MDLLRYRGKRAGRSNKQKSTGNGLRIPVICPGCRHYSVSLNIKNATSTLHICESRPLDVNVNNLICIRPDPLWSKLSTVVPLDFCLLNARSICNKSPLINDFIADQNIDLFALSGTWLRGDDLDLYYELLSACIKQTTASHPNLFSLLLLYFVAQYVLIIVV